MQLLIAARRRRKHGWRWTCGGLDGLLVAGAPISMQASPNPSWLLFVVARTPAGPSDQRSSRAGWKRKSSAAWFRENPGPNGGLSRARAREHCPSAPSQPSACFSPIWVFSFACVEVFRWGLLRLSPHLPASSLVPASSACQDFQMKKQTGMAARSNRPFDRA